MLLILDRDGLLNVASSDPTISLYYILEPGNLIIKEGVKHAINIIKTLEIKTVLATKQRCISKGLISRGDVKYINWCLEQNLNFKFDKIYVEEEEENKANLYERIIQDNPDIPLREMCLIDDSQSECEVAKSMGITAFCSNNLAEMVYFLFDLH